MSLLDEAQSFTLTKIHGAASLPDQFDRAVYSELARNMEFALGEQATTRRGFGAAWNPAKSITSMFQWLLAATNRLAFYNKTDGKVTLRNLGASTDLDILTGQSAEYADFASLGSRLLFALGTSAGIGAGQARVWDAATAPVSADKAFQPPVTTSFLSTATSEPGAGSVSAGIHKLAVVFTTRSGYETRPSPVTPGFASSGSIADLVPVSFTATGGKTLRVAIQPSAGNWPDPFVSAALLMTTVQNTARYFFVPGCTVTVAGGAATTATFPDVDISDTILAAKSSTEAVTPAKNYFGLYSQDSSAAGPFNPFLVLGYSDRAVYMTLLADGTTGIFVSNKQAPQWITLANHLIQLEEKRVMISMFVLQGTLYLLGPGWTYAASDNSALPVTWVPPQQVDGKIGTPSVYGVSANSSLGYAWVGDTSGLYLFKNGSYAARPVSYLNTPDWERINWAAAQGTFQVFDFPARKMVFVKAPLDGASSANYLMAWDYSQGQDWNQVNYTLWDSAAMPDIGALANVFDPTKRIFEIYASRYSAGKVYRSKSTAAGDTLLYSDDGVGITSQYRTCAMPQTSPQPRQLIAVRPRLRGLGTIAQTAITLDNTRSHVLSPITAAVAPGQFPLAFMDVQSEALFVEFSNGGVANSYFILAGCQVFYKDDWVMQR